MSVSARDVIKLIDDWRPRKCETEKDFERSLHKHLEKNLEKSDVIKQYAAGRVKVDIVVDGTRARAGLCYTGIGKGGVHAW